MKGKHNVDLKKKDMREEWFYVAQDMITDWLL
jgi:hypothetical protein